jgi:hypothetical protein
LNKETNRRRTDLVIRFENVWSYLVLSWEPVCPLVHDSNSINKIKIKVNINNYSDAKQSAKYWILMLSPARDHKEQGKSNIISVILEVKAKSREVVKDKGEIHCRLEKKHCIY